MERTFDVKAASVALKALQLYPVTQKVQKLLKRWTSMLCDVDTPHDPAHDSTMQCALAQQLECLQLSGKPRQPQEEGWRNGTIVVHLVLRRLVFAREEHAELVVDLHVLLLVRQQLLLHHQRVPKKLLLLLLPECKSRPRHVHSVTNFRRT